MNQSALEGYIDVAEIAQRMAMSEHTIRNKHLPKLKATCKSAKMGRKVYIDEQGFKRYVNKFKNNPNPVT